MQQFKTLPNVVGTFHEVLGYTFLDWQDGFVRLELALEPRHRNRQGWVHGGVILSLLDIAGTFAGNHSDAGPVATVTMNLSSNFLSGSKEELIHTEGRLLRKGRTAFFTDNRVVEAGSGRVLATSQGVHKYL
ncbi:MAG: PaaI family thioesterase [Alphaproteobacteria bacterium]|nr:PaaI family thioesterase [Alphaproteobacteria bacterium]